MSLSLDKNDITERINKISSIEELEKLRIEYIGKRGSLSLEIQSLSSLSIERKKIKGCILIYLLEMMELWVLGKLCY